MKLKFSSNYNVMSLFIQICELTRIGHVEFIFSDGRTIFPTPWLGRTIMAKEWSHRYEKIFELDVTAEEEATIRNWAETQLGVEYDWSAILKRRNKKESWKDGTTWICSEFVAYGLELININLFENSRKVISPYDVYNKVNLGQVPQIRKICKARKHKQGATLTLGPTT